MRRGGRAEQKARAGTGESVRSGPSTHYLLSGDGYQRELVFAAEVRPELAGGHDLLVCGVLLADSDGLEA